MAGKHVLSSFILAMLASLIVGCSGEEKTATSMTDSVSFNHLEGYVAAPPVSDGQYFYVATGSSSVHKVDIETGRIAWTYEDVGGFINSSPVLTGDAVLIIGSQGKLVSIDRETGKKNWIKPEETGTPWKMGDEELGVPSVVGCLGYDAGTNLVVVGDKEGLVFVVDAASGAIMNHIDLNARLYAKPSFHDGAVFLITMGGRIHAFNLADLSERWKLPKIVLSGAEGEKRKPGEAEDDEPQDKGSGYTVTVKYRYNFGDNDHFEAGEDGAGSRIEIFLLDKDGQPVKFVEGEGEASSRKFEEIEPGDHIGSGSHTQEATFDLVASPARETGWPLTVLLKDGKGSEIDRLECTLDFAAAEKAVE